MYTFAVPLDRALATAAGSCAVARARLSGKANVYTRISPPSRARAVLVVAPAFCGTGDRQVFVKLPNVRSDSNHPTSTDHQVKGPYVP